MALEGGYLEYDQAERIAVLKDGAHIEYRDLKLWADNIHNDLDRGQVYAQGEIELWQGQEKFRGDILSYNYKTRRGTLSELRTKRGVSFVEAEGIELEPERVLGRNVWTTTCEQRPPHYRIAARKMTLVPGERIELEGARFIVGERTLFSLSRYVINLRTGEAVDRVFLKPGYSQAKGFNLDLAYQFFVNQDLIGRVKYSPSQFEGTNVAANLRYRLDDRHDGLLDYAHHESNLISQISDRYQLLHNARLPWADARFDVLMTSNGFGALGTDSELNFRANFVRSFPGWRTALDVERRLDLDGSDYRFDQIEFLNSTPRFTFAQTGSTMLFGSGIGLAVDGSLAEIREETSGSTVSAGRAEVNMNFTMPPVRIGEFQEIFSSFRQTEDFYGTGEMRHFFSFQANSFERYSDSLTSAFNYVYQDQSGDISPFSSFDTLPGKANLLTGFLRLGNFGHFSATLFQLTRDFENGLYANASSNFVYHRPFGEGRFLSLSLTPFYDVSRDPRSLSALRLGSVSTNFRLTSNEGWSHSLITNYDALLERMQSVATRSRFFINDRLLFDVDSNLSRDPFAGGFELTRLDFGIVRDFHDFEGRLAWNAIQKEVFVEFYLKVASNRRLGLGVDYGETPELSPTFGDTSPTPFLQ